MTRRYDDREERERSRTTRETTSTVERTRLLDTTDVLYRRLVIRFTLTLRHSSCSSAGDL